VNLLELIFRLLVNSVFQFAPIKFNQNSCNFFLAVATKLTDAIDIKSNSLPTSEQVANVRSGIVIYI